MNTSTIEKRIGKIEGRLRTIQDKPFSFSSLSEEEAANMVAFQRNACLSYHKEFGGAPIEEPEQSLTIQEKARHWTRQSSTILTSFILALHQDRIVGKEREMIQRARLIPDLQPLLELAENSPAISRRREGTA